MNSYTINLCIPRTIIKHTKTNEIAQIVKTPGLEQSCYSIKSMKDGLTRFITKKQLNEYKIDFRATILFGDKSDL